MSAGNLSAAIDSRSVPALQSGSLPCRPCSSGRWRCQATSPRCRNCSSCAVPPTAIGRWASTSTSISSPAVRATGWGWWGKRAAKLLAYTHLTPSREPGRWTFEMAVHPLHRTIAVVEETARTAMSTRGGARGMPGSESGCSALPWPRCFTNSGSRRSASSGSCGGRCHPRSAPASRRDLDRRLQGRDRRGAVARSQQPRLRRSSRERRLGPRGARRSDRRTMVRPAGIPVGLAGRQVGRLLLDQAPLRRPGGDLHRRGGARDPRQGLGRVLTLDGLWDLAERQGATTAMLYVDAANTTGLEALRATWVLPRPCRPRPGAPMVTAPLPWEKSS